MDLTDDARVQVLVQFDAKDDLPAFTDALYFTPAEYAALTPKKLDALKRKRYDTFVASVRQSQTDARADRIAALKADIERMQAELAEAQEA